jgi:hypothetical protein
MARTWAEIFEASFAAPVSAVQQRVLRAVYGSEYPEGLEPYSYVSRSELARMCTDVNIHAVSQLVDPHPRPLSRSRGRGEERRCYLAGGAGAGVGAGAAGPGISGVSAST